MFHCIFNLINIDNLYQAFWGLNSRLKNLLQTFKTQSLIFDEKVDRSLLKIYAPYVNRLIVQNKFNRYLDEFSSLRQLVLCVDDHTLILQIKPYLIPHLTHLCFLLGSQFKPPSSLIKDIFSDKFPSLQHVDSCPIYDSNIISGTTSSSLKFLSIHTNSLKVVQSILVSCSNLDHFQVHLLKTSGKVSTERLAKSHQLRRLTLWTDDDELDLHDIDEILSLTPKVEHLYLQTVCSMSVINLLKSPVKLLLHLFQFDCHIQENSIEGDITSRLNDIHKIHSCFKRIKCTEETSEFRAFATD